MYTIGVCPSYSNRVFHISRTDMKEHFGKGVPPYFFFDLLSANVMEYQGNMTSAFSFRLRFGNLISNTTMRLYPRDERGRIIVAGAQNEIIEGMCRSLYSEIKAALAFDAVPTRWGNNPRLLSTLCEHYAYNHNINSRAGAPYPPEVLTPVMVWMQNYVEWWEKYSGEKV